MRPWRQTSRGAGIGVAENMPALCGGLIGLLMAWITYRDLIQPNGGWRYMLRVRRGEFDDVPMGDGAMP
jgi:hypothetical protein